MKQIINVSVPGKIMLLGEHAVVYGYPCIVSSVNKYLKVTVQIAQSKNDQVEIPKRMDDTLVKYTLESFRNKYFIKQKIHIKTESEISGFGLGSSSATVVATVQSLADLFNIELSKFQLFELSYQIVTKSQPRASGFDIASCIWGGTILFTGENKKVELLSDNLLPILVIFSGTKADTVNMVEKVAVLKKNEPEKTIESFQSIAKIVGKGRIALSQKDWMGFGKLMNNNQELLQSLGVSNYKLDKLVEICCKAGAYGAKISGAGGGDCIIAAVPMEKIEDITDSVTHYGGTVLNLKIGNTAGVK